MLEYKGHAFYGVNSEQTAKGILNAMAKNGLDVGDWIVVEDGHLDLVLLDAIHRDLWAFNTDVLARCFHISERCVEVIKYLKEDASEVFNAMCTESIDEALINEVRNCGDEGNILASYDGEEHKVKFRNRRYWCYRTN